MTVQELLSRLERVSKTPTGWMARCPAHEDTRPSLSVSATDDGRILLRCFAGCELDAIVGALRLEVRDLFADGPQPVGAERGTGVVLSRHELETFLVETEDEVVTLRLEKARRRFEPGTEPETRYRFVVLQRDPIPEDPASA